MKFLGAPSSGSEQGQTSSHSRFGQYKRSRRTPVNPNTQAQSLSRARLATASQNWRSLTDATRNAWAQLAASTPQADSLGQTVYPTGAQLYIGAFAALAQAGLTVPPALFTVSPPAAPVISAVALSVSGVFTVTTTVASSAALACIIDASPPQSPGVMFCKDLRFCLADVTAVTLHSFKTAWIAKFGTPALGRKVFVRARFVNVTGGVSATAVSSSLIVA